MAWTYGADPENQNRDAVRLNIGDTNTNDQQLQDSEVDYYLSLFGAGGVGNLNAGAVVPASIRACEGIAALYARQTDTTNQGLSVASSKRQAHSLALAHELREREASLAEVFLGGSTYSEAEKLDEDANLIQPSFRIKQFDWVQRTNNNPYWRGP